MTKMLKNIIAGAAVLAAACMFVWSGTAGAGSRRLCTAFSR